MILGIVLTVAAAFAYDAGTGRTPNGLTATAADGNAPIVNWEIVGTDWRDVKVHLKNADAEIERSWKRIVG
jgi:hypothetical protein